MKNLQAALNELKIEIIEELEGMVVVEQDYYYTSYYTVTKGFLVEIGSNGKNRGDRSYISSRKKVNLRGLDLESVLSISESLGKLAEDENSVKYKNYHRMEHYFI
jgi:hypothetical protein